VAAVCVRALPADVPKKHSWDLVEYIGHAAAPVRASGLTGGFPLFPFASLTDAYVWEQAYRAGGHQPWHPDPGQRAPSFTRG